MPSVLSVVFILPGDGGCCESAEQKLKGYLTIGSLASALRDRQFLRRFARRLADWNGAESDPPAVHVQVLSLGSRPAGQTISAFLSEQFADLSPAPDIIAVTATSAHLEPAEEIAAAAARCFPQALRVVGGPHASVLPEDLLLHAAFHVACIGEGVETLAELVLRRQDTGAEDFHRIAGIAFKDASGLVQVTPARRPVFALDEYPPPSVSLDVFGIPDPPGTAARYPVSVLAGFGCPHDCIFCAQRRIHAGSVRERSAESIFAEVRQLHARGFRKFAFVQETFLNRPKRVRRFCRYVREEGLAIEWTIEARADQVSLDMLSEMRSAGLRFLQLGVESGDEALLRAICKSISREQIVQVVEWCRALGIHTAFYMLVGLPGQGWQSILRSARLIWEHTPFNLLTRHVSVSIAIPYPGTRISRDGSVRMVDRPRRNWPDRNPVVEVGGDGEFLGRSPTETDDMTAEEIFEAWLFLDDFCHFLMHARQGAGESAERLQSMDYAGRLLYMLARRTARDLVIRAQTDWTPRQRRNALQRLADSDGPSERQFKDVAASAEPITAPLLHFLCEARFENGCSVMRRLDAAGRWNWMKLCALAWRRFGDARVQLALDEGWNDAAEGLDGHLRAVPPGAIDRCLAHAAAGESTLEGVKFFPDGRLEVFGIGFRRDARTGTLTVQAPPR